VFTLSVFAFQVFAVSDSINIGQEVIREATSTPEATPTPSAGAVFVSDTTPPVIYDLFISQITLNSATIEWKTDEPSLCQLFWGKTQEYEEGTISETTFYLKHSTKLTQFLPETTYHFKISCRDTNQNQSETKDQNFITLTPPDIIPPANVSNFEAIPGDRQITLRWKNPSDVDFKGTKIMRSEKFYPKDPWEGKLVYDGKETSFVDTGLTNGVRYYYTAFSYDFTGNYSSGAIASAVPQKPLPPKAPPEKIPPPSEEIPPVVPPPPEVEKIILEDFDFIQEGKKVPIIEGKIEVKPKKTLTISIDYEKVPEVLKTIMVTIEKDNKFFSFLLRVNKEKTAYLATILPPEEGGIYPLTITIFDYQNQTLKRIPAQMKVIKALPSLIKIPWYKKFFDLILNWFQSIWQAIKNFFRKIF